MRASLIERARQDRKSPAALKVLISNFRSRFPDEPILIVEGVDDVGPYETWIRATCGSRFVQLIPGNGKEQLLGLRKSLLEDTTGLRVGVFFFVDRDFDELRGQAAGADIFSTDRYSIENYFVDELVLQSFLRDEFRLVPGTEDFDGALKLYQLALSATVQELLPINLHIFCCRSAGVKMSTSIPDFGKIAKVDLGGGKLIEDAGRLIPRLFLTTDPLSAEALADGEREFRALHPIRRHRGKFLFAFFRRWLECLAADASSPGGKVFKRKIPMKFSAAAVDMRSCAARSERPVGFDEFIRKAYSLA